jgi:hypothetical protein
MIYQEGTPQDPGTPPGPNLLLQRAEWKDVEVLLVDEVSLLSILLNSELDHTLRYAKEHLDAWYGGLHVIFSGDFYQYPPVGGSALYTPIPHMSQQTNDNIQQRLGHLAWKTINAVVTLTE